MLAQVTEQDQSQYGIKRTCRSCGVCFYDLDKHPSECTNCGAIYELHVNTRSRRNTVVEADFSNNVSFLDLEEVEAIPADVEETSLIEDENLFGDLMEEE